MLPSISPFIRRHRLLLYWLRVSRHSLVSVTPLLAHHPASVERASTASGSGISSSTFGSSSSISVTPGSFPGTPQSSTSNTGSSTPGTTSSISSTISSSTPTASSTSSSPSLAPSSTPATVQVAGNYRYVDCYTFQYSAGAITTGTVEECAADCGTHGIMGVKAGNLCK